MVVEFTTNFVDSSYLGCLMFIKYRVLRNETHQKTEIFFIIVTSMKYIEERKITILDLTFCPIFTKLIWNKAPPPPEKKFK